MTSKPLWESRDLSQYLNSLKLEIESNKESVFISPFLQPSSMIGGTLSGAVVSIKATNTSAGSRVLGNTPAAQDADAV